MLQHTSYDFGRHWHYCRIRSVKYTRRNNTW